MEGTLVRQSIATQSRHGQPRLCAAFGLALAAGAALAQSSPAGGLSAEAELRRCRVIEDSVARMSCYDAIPLPGVVDVPSRRRTQESSAAAVASAPAASPAQAGTAAGDPRDFGLAESRPAAATAQAMESSIDGAFEGWMPGTRLRLANGQVWEVVDGSEASYRLRDPKVRVSRGLLGSFFIRIEGVAQSPRVRRVQ
jgi:hypothetical protein